MIVIFFFFFTTRIKCNAATIRKIIVFDVVFPPRFETVHYYTAYTPSERFINSNNNEKKNFTIPLVQYILCTVVYTSIRRLTGRGRHPHKPGGNVQRASL